MPRRKPRPEPQRLFQDVVGTMPAVADGDPVALWRGVQMPGVAGVSLDCIQADPTRRPTLVMLPYAASPAERRAIESTLAAQHGIDLAE